METVQQLLTLAIEATAIIGFGGTILHSMWMGHYRWCAEYMPEVTPFDEFSYHGPKASKSPEALPDKEFRCEKQEAESSNPNLIKTEPANLIKTEEVAAGLVLNKNLDTKQLRELCDRHRIQWRHYRGKGRHMPKAVMASTLASVS